MSLLTNWKTTLAGVAVLIGLAAKYANHPETVKTDDWAAVPIAFGLIVAKDHNKREF